MSHRGRGTRSTAVRALIGMGCATLATLGAFASPAGAAATAPAATTGARALGAVATVVTPAAGGYSPLTPARVLDTRNGTGGKTGPVAGNQSFDLVVAGAGGVPATGVGAVALNVTVTSPTCSAWLTVFPAGQALPGSSNLNYLATKTVANLVVVGVGVDGKVSFNVPAACVGSVVVVADVEGWYAVPTATPAAGGFSPLAPVRVLDTRNGTGGTTGPVVSNSTVDLVVAGAGGVPATGAAAVALNVTVTSPTCQSWLTVFPTAAAVPASSSLNYGDSKTVANLVVVGIGTGGKVSFNVPAACSGGVQVVADVEGWFTAPTATPAVGGYTALTPARVLDTRSGLGGTAGPVAGGQVFDLTVDGAGGVPANGVSAVALNVTVTSPTCVGWLTVFPFGLATPPSSNLNYVVGKTIASLVMVGVSAGKVSISVPAACGGTVQVVADIQGWFAA
ncbi:MAG: hypothetical protein QOJ52_3562 [Acidimicrobiaceae bacterium]|nr:hypothetical protein [Acidimicrobiaceae bacterium]